MDAPLPDRPLRRGWTTGACAAAATRGALDALWGGEAPASVPVALPSGDRPEFAIASCETGDGWACAGVVKDAGDDPDVTHGALIISTVRPGPSGSGVSFRAGPGVGTVTKPGLPLAVGEPAINPVPRLMIAAAVAEAAAAHGKSADILVEISVPGGEEIARKTLNGRLGILGGISILGTTGVVVPYSCAAWIHSIHRGIDVARGAGLTHVAGSTGSTSEAAVTALYGLPDTALIDMGDFHPIARVTIAGGFAKMVKLAQGRLDLHSRSGEIDMAVLAGWLGEQGAPPEVVTKAAAANSALEVFQLSKAAGIDLPANIAARALAVAAAAVKNEAIRVDVVVFDRLGGLLARAGGS
jgi:cobalt-precorrin-5B (C1)-methyltransferase